MPSNINSVIKNKMKKKNRFRPTDPNFFQHVTVNTHIFFFFGLSTVCPSWPLFIIRYLLLKSVARLPQPKDFNRFHVAWCERSWFRIPVQKEASADVWCHGKKKLSTVDWCLVTTAPGDGFKCKSCSKVSCKQ